MRTTSFLERLGGSAVRAEDREQLQDIGDPYNGVAVDVTYAIASNTAEAGEDFEGVRNANDAVAIEVTGSLGRGRFLRKSKIELSPK